MPSKEVLSWVRSRFMPHILVSRLRPRRYHARFDTRVDLIKQRERKDCNSIRYRLFEPHGRIYKCLHAA